MAVLIKGTCKLCNEPFEYLRDHPGKPRAYCCDEHRWKAWRKVREGRLAEAESRWCPHCKDSKPRAEFSSPSAPYCRPCMAAWARDNRKILPLAHRRAVELQWRYGLTQEQFDAKLAAQGGKCAICKSDDPGPAGWQIDHDHACCDRPKRGCPKCIRDILCANCNKAIGMLKEDPVIIQAAHDYVVAWRAKREVLRSPA